MSLSEFKSGAVICGEGDPLTQLSLIIKGNAEIIFNGKVFRYEQGDLIGLCGLNSGRHNHTYTAKSDITLITYPCKSFDGLDALLRTNAEASNHLVNSACRQLAAFVQYMQRLKQEADDVYKTIKDICPQYEQMCALYALTPKKLSGLSELEPFSGNNQFKSWLGSYYNEINSLDAAVRKAFFYNKPGISSGFIHKCTEDLLEVTQVCVSYTEYIKKTSFLLFNSGGHDLFSLVSDLHINSINIRGADAAVEMLMSRLTGTLVDLTGLESAHFQNRLGGYKEALSAKRASQNVMTDAPDTSGVKRNLSDSLDVILSYSGCSEEVHNKFTQCVHKYTKLPDRCDSEAEVSSLRKELTTMFYEIYQLVFIKSLGDPAVPTIIKMFLNFGYVDATLAGSENADYLYSIADQLKGDPAMGVYTLPEWLTAVYKGEKEPCRNEFDLDYVEYIREKKKEDRFDDKEEKRLLEDQEGKLRFEIENVFPLVNKMTFGRISVFCPLFADHNVMRKPEVTLVKPELLSEKLNEILSVDYSAYYRETLYSNAKLNINNEYIHIEVRPNIILMPNIGTRGILWQDIEGKNRKTAARMFMSVFLEADLKNLLIRLTGEFRWEICKRVQGIRWNDVTNPSLTSLYCDYLQFYKTNREFSAEIKESIKTELERAKRNYKNLFVSNYTEWINYEANGSPRLNKFVLQLLIEYCPFSAASREKLTQHPRYTELINRNNLKQQKKAQRLTNLIQQINRVTKDTPQELLDELKYLAL